MNRARVLAYRGCSDIKIRFNLGFTVGPAGCTMAYRCGFQYGSPGTAVERQEAR